MTVYTFTAHDVVEGSSVNVVGSSTYTVVFTDDDTTIGDPGDTGETVSFNGGPELSYTFLGIGVSDSGENMAVFSVLEGGVETIYTFNMDGGTLANGNTKVLYTDLVDDPVAPCFTAGTLIMTPDGERKVEDLVDGDLVCTHTNGPQPIVRILSRKVSTYELKQNRDLRPIKISKNALGDNIPHTDLVVSPQHRMLIDGWRTEYLFGEAEALATAVSLKSDQTIRQINSNEDVEYFHIVLEKHELIIANGALTESMLLSLEFINSMSISERTELATLFPELVSTPDSNLTRAVAPLLQKYEGKAVQALS